MMRRVMAVGGLVMAVALVVPAMTLPALGDEAAAASATPAANAEVVEIAKGTHFADLPDLKEYLDLKKLEPGMADAALASYMKDLDGRAQTVLNDLKLPASENEKADHVRKSVVAYYAFLRGWHDQHDKVLKPLEAGNNGRKTNAEAIAKEKESLMPFHLAFVADLSSFLTPEQVGKVKDRMVSSTRMSVIYNGYTKDNPWLTEDDKAKLMAMCLESREVALDEGSAGGKTWYMDQLKGKVVNYIAKAKKATSQPANGAATQHE